MDLGKVKELASGVKYYIGNPSAWEHYDDFISEKIRALVSEIEALAELESLAELEKPAEDDAMSAWKSLLDHFAKNNWRLNEDVCLSIFQQYAESYHAKKCAECVGNLPAFPHRPEAPNA